MTDTPKEPTLWTDEQCDKAAAQAMDRVAAARGSHTLDLNPDITAHNTLRRELIRAGAALASRAAAQAPALTEADIESAIDEANIAFNKHRSSGPRGQMVTAQDDWKHWLARAVEAKVRALAGRASTQAPAEPEWPESAEGTIRCTCDEYPHLEWCGRIDAEGMAIAFWHQRDKRLAAPAPVGVPSDEVEFTGANTDRRTDVIGLARAILAVGVPADHPLQAEPSIGRDSEPTP